MLDEEKPRKIVFKDSEVGVSAINAANLAILQENAEAKDKVLLFFINQMNEEEDLDQKTERKRKVTDIEVKVVNQLMLRKKVDLYLILDKKKHKSHKKHKKSKKKHYSSDSDSSDWKIDDESWITFENYYWVKMRKNFVEKSV